MSLDCAGQSQPADTTSQRILSLQHADGLLAHSMRTATRRSHIRLARLPLWHSTAADCTAFSWLTICGRDACGVARRRPHGWWKRMEAHCCRCCAGSWNLLTLLTIALCLCVVSSARPHPDRIRSPLTAAHDSTPHLTRLSSAPWQICTHDSAHNQVRACAGDDRSTGICCS